LSPLKALEQIEKGDGDGHRSAIVQVEKGRAEVLGLEIGKTVVVPAGFANITMPKEAPRVPVQVPEMKEFGIVDFSPTGEIIIPELEVSPVEPSPVRGEIPLNVGIKPPPEYDFEEAKIKSVGKGIKPKKKRKRKIRSWNPIGFKSRGISGFHILCWTKSGIS